LSVSLIGMIAFEIVAKAYNGKFRQKILFSSIKVYICLTVKTIV